MVHGKQIQDFSIRLGKINPASNQLLTLAGTSKIQQNAAPILGIDLTNKIYVDSLTDALDTRVTNLENVVFYQNELISGGASFLSGLTFAVTDLVYIINGQLYNSLATNVTITAGDVTFDRIDIIVVNTAGVVSVVPGIPAMNPIKPDIDESTQVEVTFITVPAGAVTLPIPITVIYNENLGPAAEWTTATNFPSNINVNSSTGTPYMGSKSIELTNVPTGKTVVFTAPTLFDTTTQNTLQFAIKNKVAWTTTRRLRITLQSLAGVQLGSLVDVYQGLYGFSSANTTSWQIISIPISKFLAPSSFIGKVVITTYSTSGTLNLYLDYFRMLVGAPVTSSQNTFLNIKDDAGNITTATTPTDILSILGGANITSVVGTKDITLNLDPNISVTNVTVGSATANRLTYFDGTKTLAPITLGTGLTLTGNVLAASANTTASNGLTKTGNDIRLGGLLTQNTNIDGAFSLGIGTISPLVYFFVQTGDALTNSYITNGYGYSEMGGSDNTAQLSSNVQSSGGGVTIGVFDQINNLYTNIMFLTAPIAVSDGSLNNYLIIEDNFSSKGLIYMDDYSLNFTDNSLINKIYADTLISNAISGTTNYISKFTSTSTLGDSIIFDNGTNVGIGTATPGNKLVIYDGTAAGTTGVDINSNTGSSSLNLNAFISGYGASGGGIINFNSNGTQYGKIQTNSSNSRFIINSLNGYTLLIQDGTTTNINVNASYGVIFGNGTQNNFISTNAGDVGIGTNLLTPSARLQVIGVGATSANYNLKLDSSTSPLLYVRNDGNVTIYKTLEIQRYNFSSTKAFWMEANSIEDTEMNTLNADLVFKTKYVSGSNVESIRFTKEGIIKIADTNYLTLGAFNVTTNKYGYLSSASNTTPGVGLKIEVCQPGNTTGVTAIQIEAGGNTLFTNNTVINTFNDGIISNTTFGIVNNRTNALSIYNGIYVPIFNIDYTGSIVSAPTLADTTPSGSSTLLGIDSLGKFFNTTIDVTTLGSISGTTNYISKFTSGSALGNSQMFDDGTNVGIGTATPTALLHILQNTVGTGAKGLSVNFNTIGEVFYIDDNGLAKYYGNAFTIAGGNAALNLISNGGVNPGLSFKYNNGSNVSGTLYGSSNSMFLSAAAFGIGDGYFNPQALLHIQGVNNLNTAFKINNLLNSSSFTIENNGNIISTINDASFNINVQGSFGLFRINTGWGDYMQVTNSGAFYFQTGVTKGSSLESGITNNYITDFNSVAPWNVVANKILVSATGTEAGIVTGLRIQKSNFTNTSATYYSAVFLDGNVGIGTATPTATIHGKALDSTSGNYTLKLDNLTSPLLYVRNDGNVGIGIAPSIADTKLEIKVATDQRFLFRNFTYSSIGASLTLQAINDATTDVVNVVALALDWYHASRNNLFSNIANIIVPTAKVHIIGNNQGSNLYALKVDNLGLNNLLSVRNDGVITAGGLYGDTTNSGTAGILGIDSLGKFFNTGISITGVGSVTTSSNKAMVAMSTTVTGEQLAGPITALPFNDSYVQVFVNGIKCSIGDGVSTSEVYFADPGVLGTPKLIQDIAIGDVLVRGDLLGFDTDATDVVDYDYSV